MVGVTPFLQCKQPYNSPYVSPATGWLVVPEEVDPRDLFELHVLHKLHAAGWYDQQAFFLAELIV